LPARTDPHHILIAAGPTYEPIDAVRFLGNRSSGRLGSALADHAAERGLTVTLLLGPNAVSPQNPRVRIVRFMSTADLEACLAQSLPQASILVMAAAVADYRPTPGELDPGGKRRRQAGGMTLHLESTPDLLAGCSKYARPDQLLVGFALEPEATMIESAHRKLARKHIDLIVANPLETMDSASIRATLIGNAERGVNMNESTGNTVSKGDFARWLLDRIVPLANIKRSHSAAASKTTEVITRSASAEEQKHGRV
jgi:phosphopantothenoylcysteine decarboxylase / phosphopantothenate---cysteine ligase